MAESALLDRLVYTETPKGGFPAWASDGAKLAWFRRYAAYLLIEFDRQLELGIGANGKRMKRRKHPRRDGATGAVLSPHGDLSRTRRLLAFKATTRAARLYWRASGRQSWRQILTYHAEGAGHLPIRDVFGVTRAGQRRALAKAQADWDAGRLSGPPTPPASRAARWRPRLPNFPYLPGVAARP